MKRNLVLTGGSSGIGAELAGALAHDWGVTSLDLAQPAAPIAGVRYATGDITTDGALDDLPDGEVDAVVHCAGIGAFGMFADMPRADWERLLMVNLHGTLNFIQQISGRIADNGRVVLFSSGTVFKSPAGAAAYAASKAGIIGFANSLAAELGARNITVNVIAPGLVLTPLSATIAAGEAANIETRAIKQAATTADFVKPVRFFLSPGASLVTGQTLVVDGGSIRR